MTPTQGEKSNWEKGDRTHKLVSGKNRGTGDRAGEKALPLKKSGFEKGNRKTINPQRRKEQIQGGKR